MTGMRSDEGITTGETGATATASLEPVVPQEARANAAIHITMEAKLL
jgi:uncharacterized RmlC-like cupin family protein